VNKGDSRKVVTMVSESKIQAQRYRIEAKRILHDLTQVSDPDVRAEMMERRDNLLHLAMSFDAIDAMQLAGLKKSA